MYISHLNPSFFCLWFLLFSLQGFYIVLNFFFAFFPNFYLIAYKCFPQHISPPNGWLQMLDKVLLQLCTFLIQGFIVTFYIHQWWFRMEFVGEGGMIETTYKIGPNNIEGFFCWTLNNIWNNFPSNFDVGNYKFHTWHFLGLLKWTSLKSFFNILSINKIMFWVKTWQSMPK